jgi:hypothetical protein
MSVAGLVASGSLGLTKQPLKKSKPIMDKNKQLA